MLKKLGNTGLFDVPPTRIAEVPNSTPWPSTNPESLSNSNIKPIQKSNQNQVCVLFLQCPAVSVRGIHKVRNITNDASLLPQTTLFENQVRSQLRVRNILLAKS